MLELMVAENLFFIIAFIAIFALVVVLAKKVKLQDRKIATLHQEKEIIYNFIYEVSEVFSEDDEEINEGVMLNKVLNQAMHISRGRSGAIYMAKDNKNGDAELCVGAVHGVFPPFTESFDEGLRNAFSKLKYIDKVIKKTPIIPGQGLIGATYVTGRGIVVGDASENKLIPKYEQDFLKIETVLMVPFRYCGKSLGVAVIVNRLDDKVFDEDDLVLLQALMDQAAITVHFTRLNINLDEKRKMDYDLTIANNIQASLLPKGIPSLNGIEIGAFSRAARQVGGDYYDFIRIDDEHIGFVVADVSGKGVAGAMMISICRTILQLIAPNCLSPAEVLKKANAALSRDLTMEMFITMSYMILDINTKELVYARAGHVYPLLARGTGAEPIELKSPGMGVGLADTAVFDLIIKDETVQLHEGDIIVNYTDGVVEAQTDAGQEWGILNLIENLHISVLDNRTAMDTANIINEKVADFVGDSQQYDDITAMVFKITGSNFFEN
jgi:sigma-B regulation protein RsbU (phosphoserine phosphatase)